MTERVTSRAPRQTAPTDDETTLSDRATDILLAPLTHGPVGLPSPFDEEQARARHLPWLEAQVSALPRERLDMQSRRSSRMAQKRLKWAGVAVAALAAGGLLTLGNRFFSSEMSGAEKTPGYATLVSGHVLSGSVEVLAGSRLGMSSRLITRPTDGAVVQGSSGFVVELGPSTNFSLLADAASGSHVAHELHAAGAAVAATSTDKKARLKQESSKDTRLLLSEGTASFNVPPLSLGSSLKVLTRDAEVKVIGTRFTVSITDKRATCVRVMEGEVLVTSRGDSRSLSAGQAWGCSSEAIRDGAPSRSASVAELSSGAASESGAASISKNHDAPKDRASATNLQKKTTLAEENALLSRALSQESQGQDRAAAAAYKELLRRFPGSPFAPEARAGLLRVDVKAP